MANDRFKVGDKTIVDENQNSVFNKLIIDNPDSLIIAGDADANSGNFAFVPYEEQTFGTTTTQIGTNFTYVRVGHPLAPYNLSLTGVVRFPFSISSGLATDVSESLAAPTQDVSGGGGWQTETYGFTGLQYRGSSAPFPSSPYRVAAATLNKFPFAIPSVPVSLNVLEMFSTLSPPSVDDFAGDNYLIVRGTEHSSFTHGYGRNSFFGFSTPGHPTQLFKYSFNADTDIAFIDGHIGSPTTVGNTAATQTFSAGFITSLGSLSTGVEPFPFPYSSANLRIDKFPFSSEILETDVAELGTRADDATGSQNETHSYIVGGSAGNAPPAPPGTFLQLEPGMQDLIQRFPFSAPAGISTDIGELSRRRRFAASSSGPSDGFVFAGYSYPPSAPNAYPLFTSPNFNPRDATIEKFSFANPSTSSDVGELFPETSTLVAAMVD